MAIFEAKKKRGTLGFWYCLFVILISMGNWNCGCNTRSEKEIRERFYGSLLNLSALDSGDGSIAKMFDRVLEKEFSENDQLEDKLALQIDALIAFVRDSDADGARYAKEVCDAIVAKCLTRRMKTVEKVLIFVNILVLFLVMGIIFMISVLGFA
ncbi:hypothetical protein ACB092_05G108700 [Castanea dentata]